MAATLPWIKVDTDIAEHPKTKRLGFRLKVRRAHRFIVDLWLWCGKCAPTGRIAGPDAELVLEDAAGWEGAPGVFAQAAIDLGLVDRDGADLWVHDWDEHNRAHIRKVLSDRLRTARSRAKTRILKQSGDALTEEAMEALVEQDKAVLAARRALEDFDLSSDGRETVEGESRDHRATVEGEKEIEKEKKQETTHTPAREASSSSGPAQPQAQPAARQPEPPLVGQQPPPGVEATRPAHGRAPEPPGKPGPLTSPQRSDCGYDELRAEWLALAARPGVTVAAWDDLMPVGKRNLFDGVAQTQPRVFWRGVMDAIAEQPSLQGHGRDGWVISPDFLLDRKSEGNVGRILARHWMRGKGPERPATAPSAGQKFKHRGGYVGAEEIDLSQARTGRLED